MSKVALDPWATFLLLVCASTPVNQNILLDPPLLTLT